MCAFWCARWNGEIPGNAGSLKLPAAADSCKIFVVGAGGKFPGREKIGISQQSTRPVGRNFLGPDFRETPGFVRQKENSYLKASQVGNSYERWGAVVLRGFILVDKIITGLTPRGPKAKKFE